MSSTTEQAAGSLTRLAELASTAIETQIRLGRDYVDFVRTSISDGPGRAAAGRAYLEAARREGEQYWRGLSELGLAYAADAVALGTKAGEAVGRTLRTGAAEPAAAGEVAVSGPLGSVVTARVTVANRHNRPRRIALRPGPLLADDGHELAATVATTPASVTVPAGEEADVMLTVDLDPDVFIAGGRYTARIEVSGGEEATLLLVVRVTD